VDKAESSALLGGPPIALLRVFCAQQIHNSALIVSEITAKLLVLGLPRTVLGAQEHSWTCRFASQPGK
jgi:hypothetical protein